MVFFTGFDSIEDKKNINIDPLEYDLHSEGNNRNYYLMTLNNEPINRLSPLNI